MRRRLASLLMVLVVALSMLSGCDYVEVTTSKDKNLKTINVGYMANYASLWSVTNAIEMEYMRKEGFQVNLVEYPDGPTIIVALESGAIDVGYIGNGAHTECINGNAKIFALSHLSNADAVIATNGIASIKDLEGKMVGYVGGTSSETILVNSLEKEGMSMNDILPVDLRQQDIVAAIERGDVDAVAIWSPYSLEIMETVEGAVKLSDNMTFSDETVSLGSWAASNETVEMNSAMLVRFARALFKAMDSAANENQEQTASYVATQLGKDQESIYTQRGDAKWLTGLEVAQGAEDGTIRNYYELQRQGFVNAGMVSEGTNVDDYVVFDIMVKAGNYN